jgi:regulator of sigma E protease
VSWLLAFLGFAALIVLHELGHFAAAKAVGMRVEKFSLFFGRFLFSVRRGETTYGIGFIPAGGYVKISGMNPAEELPPDVRPRAYFNQPVWKRLVVIGAGPAVNLVLAFVILAVLFLANGYVETSNRVERVDPGSPAAGVLQPGDELLAVDGDEGEIGVLTQAIARHRCEGRQTQGCRAEEPAVVRIRRDGAVREVELTPVFDAERRRTRIGVGFGARPVELGVGGAAERSLDTMWEVTSATVSTIGRIFVDSEARQDVRGIVSSYENTRQSFEFDVTQAIFVLGLISLSLAVVNLFPFLPLDGGHIFWAVAEKVRGRAIPFSIMERASVVGFMLVLLLFFIGFTNDLDRLRDGDLVQR